MTPTEIATVAATTLQAARALIAAPGTWAPCDTWNSEDDVDAVPFGQADRRSALQAINHVAWEGRPNHVSVRCANRSRWASRALSGWVRSSNLQAWDRDPSVTHGEVLEAFDNAIAAANA